ncbi:MAG: 4Fe-4S dicluster domain-containing protein, partial [Candidatus Altarchaeaceae archaeon]
KASENKQATDIFSLVDSCIGCKLCDQACPIKLNPSNAIAKIKIVREREKSKQIDIETKKIEVKEISAPVKKKTKKLIEEYLEKGAYTQMELVKIIGTTKQNIHSFIKKIESGRKEKKLPFYIYKEGKEIYISFKPILKAQINSCVSCGLCVKKCPNGINIPEIISAIKRGEEISKNFKIINNLKKCSSCKLCESVCPKKIQISDIIEEQRQKLNIKREIKEISDEELRKIADSCVFCGRCESWCPKKIRIPNIFAKVIADRFEKERAKLSPGRGAIQDVEIRTVG